MKVHRPTDNPLSRGYSLGHKGYDFKGLGRPDEVRAGKDGVIVQRTNKYVNNWQATPPLQTKDYGNYIKIKHNGGTYELHAHLRKDSSLNLGTQVKAGQVVARIGNTGNSTGPHLHSEYRTSQNVNTSVEFYTGGENMSDLDKCLEAHKQAVDSAVEWENKHKARVKEIDALNKVISGKDSAITTAQRERDEAVAKAANCKEEVSRLRDQLLNLERINQGLSVSAKELAAFNDKQGREIGALKIRVAELETEVRELKKAVTDPLTLGDAIALVIKKLFGR